MFRTIQILADTATAGDHGVVTSVRTALPVVDLRDDPTALRRRLRAA